MNTLKFIFLNLLVFSFPYLTNHTASAEISDKELEQLIQEAQRETMAAETPAQPTKTQSHEQGLIEPEDMVLTESQEANTSGLQSKISQLGEKLKKFNDEAKKIIPNSDKLIKESLKRRQERQKKAYEAAQRKHGGGSYPYSRSGGQGYYGSPGYGSSGYSPSGYRSYTPSRSYGEGGGYGGGSASYPSFGAGSGMGSSEYDKDKSRMGRGLEKSTDQFKGLSDESEKTDKANKTNTSKDRAFSDKQKKQTQTTEKVKTQTESIKNILKNIVNSVENISEPTEDQKQESRRAVYDSLLTGDTLQELLSEFTHREKMAQSLPQAKRKTLVNSEEKKLWHKFLPHLMNLFIHKSSDETVRSDLRTCNNLLSKLQLYKYISESDIKNEQAKIEATLVTKIKKEIEKPSEELPILLQQAKNLPKRTAQNKELKDLIHKATLILSTEDTKEKNPTTAAKPQAK